MALIIPVRKASADNHKKKRNNIKKRNCENGQQGIIVVLKLFIIFINDALISITHVNCVFDDYADDKNCLISARDMSGLLDGSNSFYSAISNWITNEGLSLTLSKTV